MTTKTDREFDFRGFMRVVNRELFDIYVRRLIREQLFTLYGSDDQCLEDESHLIYEAEIALKEHLAQFESKIPDTPRLVDMLIKLLIEYQVFDCDIEEEEKTAVLSTLLDVNFSTLIPTRISMTPRHERYSEPSFA
jgi:hypothetical protein